MVMGSEAGAGRARAASRGPSGALPRASAARSRGRRAAAPQVLGFPSEPLWERLVPLSAGRVKFAVLCSVPWGWKSRARVPTPPKTQMAAACEVDCRSGGEGSAARLAGALGAGRLSGRRHGFCPRGGHRHERVLSCRRRLQATRNLFTGFLTGSSSQNHGFHWEVPS